MMKKKLKWRNAKTTKMKKSAPVHQVRIVYRGRSRSATERRF